MVGRLTSCQIVFFFFFCRPNPEDYIPPESEFHWALSILPMLRLAMNLINHATFLKVVNIAFVCFY